MNNRQKRKILEILRRAKQSGISAPKIYDRMGNLRGGITPNMVRSYLDRSSSAVRLKNAQGNQCTDHRGGYLFVDVKFTQKSFLPV